MTTVCMPIDNRQVAIYRYVGMHNVCMLLFIEQEQREGEWEGQGRRRGRRRRRRKGEMMVFRAK